MGLSLVAGPANAGKLRLLGERYLDALPQEPVLIVPTRSDVERVQRLLVGRAGGLLGGTIGTFDDVCERVARDGAAARPVATETQRALLVRSVVAGASLNGLGPSSRSSGFAEALAGALAELDSGLVDPEDLDGDLAVLHRAYRLELERRGVWDRHRLRRYAAERVAGELAAWDGRPVFVYGFEDLTGVQWALLEALAGRADVTVSLPYEPDRPAFASLGRTATDLASLAAGRIEELPPRYGEIAPPALAHLERALFAERPPPPPPLEGAVRFLEGAGARGVLELVADEILELLRGDVDPGEIVVACPSVEDLRVPLETAFGGLGVPYALESSVRLPHTAFGHALVSLLRFAWLGGDRRHLYAFLRSPFSGLARAHVDFLEGRLRGRGVLSAERVLEESTRLRGQPLPLVETVRAADDPVAAVRAAVPALLRGAYGLERPPAGESVRVDLRAAEAVAALSTELEGWVDLGGGLAADDVVAALEHASVRLGEVNEPGRVAVVDLLAARTRRPQVLFLLGLEEGNLPRRASTSPFLDDDARRELDARSRRFRLARPDPVARGRYLFYTACTRPSRRLYLVREAATDDGSPREPSPFWQEVETLFDRDDVRRWTRRRPLSQLTWPLESAPSERERLRALAVLASGPEGRDVAGELARANGWERRFERARAAFRRPTRLTHPAVVAEVGARTLFNVTELERFADCSSAWLLDRVIDPKTIDAEVDAKLRGSVAHTALSRFFNGLPRELGSDRVTEENVEPAVRFLRSCLEQALAGVRMEMTDVEAQELEQGLLRDLEQLVRDEAHSPVPLVPSRFEVAFGSERSAPELQRGLDLGDGLVLAGKIDRIDLDPFSARGIVQDYKAGKGAHSARAIERELRLQIPLYMLVLRDLVGIEPLGGVYRPLAGDRKPRGLLRAEAREDAVPGFALADYLDEDAFWGQVEGARATARGLAERIRAGDVRHDPKGGECPAWCDLWPMCRVRRS